MTVQSASCPAHIQPHVQTYGTQAATQHSWLHFCALLINPPKTARALCRAATLQDLGAVCSSSTQTCLLGELLNVIAGSRVVGQAQHARKAVKAVAHLYSGWQAQRKRQCDACAQMHHGLNQCRPGQLQVAPHWALHRVTTLDRNIERCTLSNCEVTHRDVNGFPKDAVPLVCIGNDLPQSQVGN